MSMTRRQWLASTFPAAALASDPLDRKTRARILQYLASHRHPQGGYHWSSDVTPQLTPTFAVVGSYHILGEPVPNKVDVANFIRSRYPVPEGRRKERPIWRFDWEQVQALQWLGEDVESFRARATTWDRPSEFTKAYELDGQPVFQFQALAVRTRHLLGIAEDSKENWATYFTARQRPNGTFNATPATDGSSGHVMNTLWGLWALESLGMDRPPGRPLTDWVRSCQHTSGGFRYQPNPGIGNVDDLCYTWAALHILGLYSAAPSDSDACAKWIESLMTEEGGFQHRPGGEPNPLATFYALDSMRLLGRTLRGSSTRAPRAARHAIGSRSRVFTIQIEAPGSGSPAEAVELARALGVHIWCAKNSQPGWTAEAQRLANEQKAAVLFAVGNEEYGTFTKIEGLGTYSHLVDVIGPSSEKIGSPLEKKSHPYPWSEFRDTRIRAVRAGGGRMIWQFLENEELTMALLDEAVEKGTYAAISSFHFGNENFLHSQPFLHRWYGRLPFVGLQDAHGTESWWWGDMLAGFRTLFVAKEPSWAAWLEALDKGHVLAVRHDAVTSWRTEFAGGSPDLRRFVQQREAEWKWWDEAGRPAKRLAGALTLLTPSSKFEQGAPADGIALRLRLWHDNNGQGVPQRPRVEFVDLALDGKPVMPQAGGSARDPYLQYRLEDTEGDHRAEARLRVIDTGKTMVVSRTWKGRAHSRGMI